MTLYAAVYGVKKIIYADAYYATKVQPLHSFFVSRIDKHASEASARERAPCAGGQ